jgi:hypothetical protein
MTSPRMASGVHSVIGVDAGSANLREADHLIHHWVDRLALPPDTVGCTHLIRTGDRPHVALSFALPDPAAAAAAWHRLTALLAQDAEQTTGAALGELRHGPAEAAHDAARAAEEQARRTGGRAVAYPGVQRLTGIAPLGLVLAHSAIERITLLGAPSGTDQPDPRTPVLTRDHVRPTWQNGELVLPLVPAAGGKLAPFEVPDPTPCCADHD